MSEELGLSLDEYMKIQLDVVKYMLIDIEPNDFDNISADEKKAVYAMLDDISKTVYAFKMSLNKAP